MHRLVVLFLVVVGCGKSDIERNPFLPELRFSVPINLALPQYDNLRYAGGTYLFPQYGHKGIVVLNLDGSRFLAWEASCPNHLPNDCSQTSVVGINTECQCEGYQYNLASGQLLNPPEGEGRVYPLINYLIEQRGANLIISN